MLRNWRTPFAAAIALTAALGCGRAVSSTQPGSSTLRTLHSVQELQAAFEADVGKTRIVLLVSPT